MWSFDDFGSSSEQLVVKNFLLTLLFCSRRVTVLGQKHANVHETSKKHSWILNSSMVEFLQHEIPLVLQVSGLKMGHISHLLEIVGISQETYWQRHKYMQTRPHFLLWDRCPTSNSWGVLKGNAVSHLFYSQGTTNRTAITGHLCVNGD